MGDIDYAVDHLLDGCDTREELGSLFRLCYRLGKSFAQCVCAPQYSSAYVIPLNVSVHRVADVNEPMSAEDDEFPVGQEDLRQKLSIDKLNREVEGANGKGDTLTLGGWFLSTVCRKASMAWVK